MNKEIDKKYCIKCGILLNNKTSDLCRDCLIRKFEIVKEFENKEEYKYHKTKLNFKLRELGYLKK